MTTGGDAQSEFPESVVERWSRDGVQVLTLSGELDLDTVDEIVPALEAALAEAPAALVVDLSRVTFADSSALNLLLRTHARTSLHLGGPLHSAVQRMFEVTGVTGVFNTHSSPDDAIAAALEQQ